MTRSLTITSHSARASQLRGNTPADWAAAATAAAVTDRVTDEEGLPRAKRVRLSGEQHILFNNVLFSKLELQKLLDKCIADQVKPLVREAFARLPERTRDGLNGHQIRRKLMGELTKCQPFAAEFFKGNGTISHSYQNQLAERARVRVAELSKLPEFKDPHADASKAWKEPLGQSSTPNGIAPTIRKETPVPVPKHPGFPISNAILRKLPPGTPIQAPTGRTGVFTPKTSNTPIPLPHIPGLTRQNLPRREAPGAAGYSANSFDGSDERRPGPGQNKTWSSQASVPSGASSPPRPVTPPRQARAQIATTSPQNYRTRAHARAWKENRLGGGDATVQQSKGLLWYGKRRPYLPARQREEIAQGAQRVFQTTGLPEPLVVHVDFESREVRFLHQVARRLVGGEAKKDPMRDLARNLKKEPTRLISRILEASDLAEGLPGRSLADIENFLLDCARKVHPKEPVLLTLRDDADDQQGAAMASSRIDQLLMAREIYGHRGGAAMRQTQNFMNEFKKCWENELELREEWTNCAGDIATITWVSNDAFICGTTNHSDSRNQQYNKKGNLVLGSCSRASVKAFPDHRIIRPVVETGENSTIAMQESQEPWLYSSVVSSDYDSAHNRAYTSSFDRTVKVWRAEKTGVSMALLGEWVHEGNVNFVTVSKHGSGLVATAADVPSEAVRVYEVNRNDVSNSRFRGYSCSRITDDMGNTIYTDKWAYFPATMQWGIHPEVQKLLVVGYSPRSRTGDDNDIPEDRRNSGELCIWDAITGSRFRVTSATSQNVFEVLWHPKLPCFIAATSPLGSDLDSSVRTQVRIFALVDNPDEGGKAFSPVKTLDCAAIDINELTIMPNSLKSSYVTAACTDGNVYVWDSALPQDKPIHVLQHGRPIEEIDRRADREKEDVGVKFTSWGSTLDRFYSGSSDGVVKVWNVRSASQPLERDLLEVPGPVSYGMFSPDKTKLLIGDATGRIFLLSMDDETEAQKASFIKIPRGGGRFRTVRRPKPITLHADIPAPREGGSSSQELGRLYLDRQQLEIHPNPTVGAVQGPRYVETGLYLKEAHFNDDPTQPLLAGVEQDQQENKKMYRLRDRAHRFPLRLRPPRKPAGKLHADNTTTDLALKSNLERAIALSGDESAKERFSSDVDVGRDCVFVTETEDVVTIPKYVSEDGKEEFYLD